MTPTRLPKHRAPSQHVPARYFRAVGAAIASAALVSTCAFIVSPAANGAPDHTPELRTQRALIIPPDASGPDRFPNGDRAAAGFEPTGGPSDSDQGAPSEPVDASTTHPANGPGDTNSRSGSDGSPSTGPIDAGGGPGGDGPGGNRPGPSGDRPNPGSPPDPTSPSANNPLPAAPVPNSPKPVQPAAPKPDPAPAPKPTPSPKPDKPACGILEAIIFGCR